LITVAALIGNSGPLSGPVEPQEAGGVNTPMTDVLADDMQHARGVLAELCERGDELLSREQHLNVLEAFDSL
jgi:hypothetical protein